MLHYKNSASPENQEVGEKYLNFVKDVLGGKILTYNRVEDDPTSEAGIREREELNKRVGEEYRLAGLVWALFKETRENIAACLLDQSMIGIRTKEGMRCNEFAGLILYKAICDQADHSFSYMNILSSDGKSTAHNLVFIGLTDLPMIVDFNKVASSIKNKAEKNKSILSLDFWNTKNPIATYYDFFNNIILLNQEQQLNADLKKVQLSLNIDNVFEWFKSLPKNSRVHEKIKAMEDLLNQKALALGYKDMENLLNEKAFERRYQEHLSSSGMAKYMEKLFGEELAIKSASEVVVKNIAPVLSPIISFFNRFSAPDDINKQPDSKPII